MQVFMDSANVKAIQDAVEHGLIDGVTTNPSLIAKEGRNFREVVEERRYVGSFPARSAWRW